MALGVICIYCLGGITCKVFVKTSIFSLVYLNDLDFVCLCRSEAQVTTNNCTEMNETDVQFSSMRTALRLNRTPTYKNTDKTVTQDKC